MLVPVLTHLGGLLVAALPLVLCWYLLHGLSRPREEEDLLSEVLVQELISQASSPRQPAAGPPALEPAAEEPEPPAIEPPF